MIKYKKNCAVCNTIKTHPKGKKLAERIYFSTHYNPTSTETLKDISDAHPKDFSYGSLRNHVKKHQFLTESDRDNAIVDKIQKKAESRISKERVKHNDVRKLVMDIGFEGIKQGNIKLNAANVLNAAKDEAAWESKQADRQLAMMEMVYHYTSGEANKSKAYDRRILTAEEVSDNDPTELSQGAIDEGEARPDSLHRGVFGAPPSPGSTEVSKRNP